LARVDGGKEHAVNLTAGQRIGPYEIIAALGAGGMGEVYRARDTKLNRDVAIKVLLPAVANDPDRLARFSREAQVLASLNHPNIAAIYGIEESNGVTALVMELVEGEDLSQRIARGAIPIDEALPIARQIAEALEAAHELGIIHRDLKPANVKVRPDGTVKVLDFGLAKAIDPTAGSSASAMNSPTLSMHGTQAGIILGTAAYMAPEQAKGKAVDKRADVWAFGVVLFEMLTGTQAFPGDDISDTLATLLKFEPDWSRLPADVPPSIRRLLKRCLMKDPKSRLRECGSAIVDIDDAVRGDDSVIAAPPDRQRSSVTQRWLLPAALVALFAMAGVTAWSLRARQTEATPQPTRRFTITVPDPYMLPPGTGTLVSLTPDGRTLVYRAAQTGGSQLFRRSIDQFDATPIAGTENSREPLFFSPDGQWLGFHGGESIKKVALAGGPAQVLAKQTANMRGASWDADGTIIFGGDVDGGPLLKMTAAGGDRTPLFKSGGAQRAWYPQRLPGGKVLFTLSMNVPDQGNLHLLDLASGEYRDVMPNAVAGRVLPSGHLIFLRSATLWAVPFDTDRLEPVGTPVPVVEGVRVEGGGAVQFAVSDEGTLAYVPGTAQSGIQRTLAFVSQEGRLEAIPVPPRDYEDVALSPDQTRIAVVIGSASNADIWVADVARGSLTRVTNEAGYDRNPLWSRDGTSIVFTSVRDGQWTIQRKAADGTGTTTELARFDKARFVAPMSWSPDGLTLVAAVDLDIMTVPADGNGAPKLLIALARQAVISPDGRWVAYLSNDGGASEVYLQRFPMLGDRRVVSGQGFSYMPTWSRDGSELLYLQGAVVGPPTAIMSVSVRADRQGRAEIGTPIVKGAFTYYSRADAYRSYDVTRDRQKLLIISRSGAAGESLRRIHIVTNWFDELKRLVPIK
jgi:Tol biopolymer transport system component